MAGLAIASSQRRSTAALLALALGGFGIGLTEFCIVGLLPVIAQDFDVSDAIAGYLVSGYALSVAAGGVFLTLAVTRLNRKLVLLGLMLLFIAGNLISGLAGTFEVMLLGRVVAALCHGAFFGIGAVLASDLVPPQRKAGAVSVMFGGLTLANVLGVPLGTLLGQAGGWRLTFVVISALGVVAFLGIAFLVPGRSSRDKESQPRGVRAELEVFRHGQVWLSLTITVLGFGGMFGALTYIAYTLTEVSGFPSGAIPWLLVLFGAGVFVGNLVGGRAADRNLTATLVITTGGQVVLLAVFALTAHLQPATYLSLTLMGAIAFAAVPGLQMRVLRYAGDAPTLASGSNIAAFNVGNALGAWVCGLTLDAGLGYTAPLWAASAMAAAALVVLVSATVLERRFRRVVPCA